jgi:hypothetical protein
VHVLVCTCMCVCMYPIPRQFGLKLRVRVYKHAHTHIHACIFFIYMGTHTHIHIHIYTAIKRQITSVCGWRKGKEKEEGSEAEGVLLTPETPAPSSVLLRCGHRYVPCSLHTHILCTACAHMRLP